MHFARLTTSFVVLITGASAILGKDQRPEPDTENVRITQITGLGKCAEGSRARNKGERAQDVLVIIEY